MLFCTCLPGLSQQSEEQIDVLENIQQHEVVPAGAELLLEEWQDGLSFSLNLNSSTLWQLESCGLFTPFQARQIFDYREKFGPLLSIYELASLPGFRKAQLEGLALHMTVHAYARQSRVNPARGSLILCTGLSSAFVESRDRYVGTALKTGMRLKLNPGRRLKLGLAYEKDAGEKIFYGNRPEHISGFLEWKGQKIIRQIVLGSFRVHNGSGLVLGSGLMFNLESSHGNPTLLSSIKPYAGLSEMLMHQGGACKIKLGNLKISSWISFQHIDLSLGKQPGKDSAPDWSELIRPGGYHRTATEIAGRDLAYLGSAGIQVQTSLKRLSIGLQYATEFSSLTRKGMDSLQYYNKPSTFHSGSIHWHWGLKKLELYGELAPDSKSSLSFLTGSHFYFNDFLSGSVQVHNYGIQHRETFASAFSSGSRISNEMGLGIYLHAEPLGKIRSDFVVELFKHPGPRFAAQFPSSGFRFRLTLKNGSHEALQWRIRLIAVGKQTSSSRPEQSNRMDGRVIYTPKSWVSWQSRLIISYSPGKFAEKGYAALQQITFRHKKGIRLTAHLVLFHIPSWDRRIYIYEPVLYQQFSFPVYNGSGNKLTLLFSIKTGQRISMEIKGSLLFESELKKWETAMQLRVRL